MQHRRRTNVTPARVIAKETVHKRFMPGFPGWDAEGHEAFLDSIPIGLAGVVVDTEHHGSAPWTRYVVEFHDGSRANGLIMGVDIKLDPTPAYPVDCT